MLCYIIIVVLIKTTTREDTVFYGELHSGIGYFFR